MSPTSIMYLWLDLLRDTDIKKLENDYQDIKRKNIFKNQSLYVDTKDNSPQKPSELINRENAQEVIKYTYELLKQNWSLEKMTNSLYKKAT